MAGSGDPRSDTDLVTAARAGDAAALEALMVRYQPRVYRFGVKMCRDAEDAADVVQETLAAMARTIGTFRGDASVPTWLYSIARNFCISRRRKSALARLDPLEEASAERLPDPGADPERAAAGREVAAALSKAIGSLDAAKREVLLLRDVEGLSAAEVAKVLGLTVQAVKSRLHRARLAVRAQVAPLLGAPAAAAPLTDQCPDVLMLFSRHLEGEIAPEVCAEMEAHLEACGQCRGACESLKRTLALCGAMPSPALPASIRDSVRHAIRVFLQQRGR